MAYEIPLENPEKLRGPEVGTIMRYRNAYSDYKRDVLVKILARSYVWAPGDPSYHGGVRRYDWSVVQWGPAESSRVVVDDFNLYPIQLGDIVTPQEEVQS